MGKDYSELKKVAIKLRRKGYSYGEIKRKIGTPKSTLSYWLKYVPLKLKDKERLYSKQVKILSLGPSSQKERRRVEVEKIITEAAKEVNLPLNLDFYRLIGAALYWAEGGKFGRLDFTNSDPYMVLFMVNWLKKVFGVPPEKLRAWLNIYEQQNERQIKHFWSDLSSIPVENFGKSYVKPTSSGYKKNNLYYGTIRITVPKSTDMKHRIFGWVKGILSDIEDKVQLTEKRWQSLASVDRPVNLK